MVNAPPQAASATPTSTTAEAFDLLRDEEAWEITSPNNMEGQSLSASALTSSDGGGQIMPANLKIELSSCIQLDKII